MTQHATLTVERWAAHSFGKQVLMIANEMNRAKSLLRRPEDRDRLRNSFERVLNLTDLTIACANRPAARRELLRWRDLVAEMYIAPEADAQAHRAAFRALLLLTPEASTQVPYVLD